MEDHAVVEMVLRQKDEVVDCLGCSLRIERNDECAHICLHSGAIGLRESITVAGALPHFGFCNAVAGFFGQPAAAEVALATACAFLSAAEPLVPEEIVTLVNFEFCCVAAVASNCLSCAVSATGFPTVVLVVELEDRAKERAVNSKAAPRRQAMT